MKELPVVIVGGGISGLSAAYRLKKAGRPVIVCEASSRFGGNIQTVSHDGFLYDLGPDSFLKAKPAGVELVRELGLEDELVTPAPGGGEVFVARDGALYPMPEGLSLGVPKKPGPLMNTALLSGPAKLRAMMEPFVRRPASLGEETIHEFLSRRLGSEMAERLAAPLLAGVFAGDAKTLSMDAAFPQLIDLEKKHGSLFSGMNGGRSILKVLFQEKKTTLSPFVSLRRGLGALVDALVDTLGEEVLRSDTRVERIRGRGDDALVCVKSGAGKETILASHIIVAGPPWVAAKLLGEVDEIAGRMLSAVRGFHTATVFFGLDTTRTHHELSGSGFIVPPGEGQILAGTFISSKWAGRAPSGHALVRAFVGGARMDVSEKSDEQIQKIAQEELGRLLGALGPIGFCRVHRYSRGTPQPELGHLGRLATIRARLRAHPEISLVGSGYGGVGIPDCIRQANETVETILASE